MRRSWMRPARIVCTLLAIGLGARCLAVPPDSFDWRKVGGNNYMTLAKPQGPMECRQFAGMATLEAKIKIVTHRPDWEVDLSERHIITRTPGTSGLSLAMHTGILSEADMPYDVQPPVWPPGWLNRTYRITARLDVPVYNEDEPGIREYIQSLLRTHGPLYVQNWHGNTLVGYDNTRQVWTFKETAGPNYGDNGYIEIPYSQSYMSGGHLEVITGNVTYAGKVLIPEPATLGLLGAAVPLLLKRKSKRPRALTSAADVGARSVRRRQEVR